MPSFMRSASLKSAPSTPPSRRGSSAFCMGFPQRISFFVSFSRAQQRGPNPVPFPLTRSLSKEIPSLVQAHPPPLPPNSTFFYFSAEYHVPVFPNYFAFGFFSGSHIALSEKVPRQPPSFWSTMRPNSDSPKGWPANQSFLLFVVGHEFESPWFMSPFLAL